MNKFIYKNAGSVNSLPENPIISRFVSPWDTSGWYSVLPDFKAGKKIYSNVDVKVLSCPKKYYGSDYIMTFNSNAEGFDDKQEVDFYVECDAIVDVCLDASAPLPEWIGGFVDTGDTVITTNGANYRIYEKNFSDGGQVHIPGLSGDGDHFFVLARPKKAAEPEAAPCAPTANSLGKYVGRTYKSYVSETFNSPGALGAFVRSEDVTLEESASDGRDKFAKISGQGFIEKLIPDMGERVVCSATVVPESADGIYGVCAFVGENDKNVAALFIDGGKIKVTTSLDSRTLSDISYGEPLNAKLVYDSAAGACDVWLNCRLISKGIPAEGHAAAIGFYATDGALCVDDLKVYDDTEVFVSDESGSSLSADKFTVTSETQISREPVPFASRPSVKFSGCATYPIKSISGEGSFEVKLKASDRGFCKVALMTDGGEAGGVALYKNSLYVSNGDEWLEVFAGLVDWCYYPSGNWFYLKITFDTTKKTFDLWVDGACRAAGMALAREGDISGVGFSSTRGTEILIEKICAYDAADLCRGVVPNAPVFNVRDYGAQGDGVTLDTEAIQKAVDDAAYTGGTVLLSGGTFFSGEIKLRSDITFFVAPDATLLGTQDHSKYPLREPRTSLCAHRQLGRGLLYGENVKNVTVTGGGMLDGNGLYRFKMNDPVSDRRELDARPDIVYITYSNNITIENINFKSSAFWTVVPLSSGNVTLRNLNLDCMNTPNRDGIDPVDCHDMTVENCRVMAGDDGLCFKSSDPVGCYNIDVRNMMIQSLASGIKFGTDTYYCLKDAHISDCTVKNVNRCGVSLETVDGAAVENVVFERIDMIDVGAPVYVVVGARNRLPRGVDTVRRSYIDGVTFRDIRFEKAYPFSYTKDVREVIVCGQSEEQRADNVTFERCRFELAGGFETLPGAPTPIDAKYPEYDRHGLSAGHAFTVRYAKNFAARDCEIILDKPDVRPMTAVFDN